MTLLVVIVLVVVGLGLGAYALLAPYGRKAVGVPAPTTLAPPDESADTERWITDADRGFSDLPEAARCDLAFALGRVDNQSAGALLVRALDDPSDAVALAAAHALISNRRPAGLDAYAAANPDRARRLLDTLALLA